MLSSLIHLLLKAVVNLFLFCPFGNCHKNQDILKSHFSVTY